MEFAIVIFKNEEESTGIIPTNWMNYDRNICWYPNVLGENMRHKYLITRETPKNHWLVCPIRVLKEFASYEDARSHLQEAEDLSALKHDSEPKSPNKRKRKSTSDEEVEYLVTKRCSDEEELLQMKTKRFFVDSSSPVTETVKTPTIVSVVSCKENGDSIEIHEGCSGEIEQLKLNQNTMWFVVKDILKKLENIDAKLDKLIQFQGQRYSEDACPQDDSEMSEEINLISSLPTDFDGFNKLCKRISENLSFRQRLTRILMNVGGKDAKAFVSNILRRVIIDEAGERFSLTGKSHKNGEKVSFQKTELYRLIIEICYQVHSNEKLNVVREAISDWLLQSKFRRSRREQRMIASLEKDEQITGTN